MDDVNDAGRSSLELGRDVPVVVEVPVVSVVLDWRREHENLRNAHMSCGIIPSMEKIGGKFIVAIILLVIAVGGGVFFLGRGSQGSVSKDEGTKSAQERTGKTLRRPTSRHAAVPIEDDEALAEKAASKESEKDDEDVTEDPEDGESSPDDLEEKLVDAFDALTDKWQEPAADKVTMDEVKKFREGLAKVPKSRKEECVQRALNLVPDENVMLLAGILFDKSQDREILELVYNDILNRDEDVKKPILREVFKDKEHPCWADTAWILDVTGELPNKKGEDDK